MVDSFFIYIVNIFALNLHLNSLYGKNSFSHYSEKIILPKVAFHTLGCKLNFLKPLQFLGILTPLLLRKYLDNYADIYVINTCSLQKMLTNDLKAWLIKLLV